jgi:hypothetical protein
MRARAVRDALRKAIATRRGSCSWDVDHVGWVVTLHSPEVQHCYGRALDDPLNWCLVWLMAPERGSDRSGSEEPCAPTARNRSYLERGRHKP